MSSKWHIIRPSDWIPENLSKLDDETQRSYNINCWSVALEKTKEAIEEISPTDIIVLDACNSKYTTTISLITNARKHLHRAVLLFVQSDSNLCLSRNSKITKLLLDDYVNRFKTSLPEYKKACDLFLIVRNNGTIEQLTTELRGVLVKLKSMI
jgi:predicted kinase